MQVHWKKRDLSGGLGHGVEFHLSLGGTSSAVGFIEGYSWLHDDKLVVDAYIDSRLVDFPRSVAVELRLAMLLFLTDERRQQSGSTIHGFRVGFNA
jgi:hypothetical protein